MVTTAAAPSVGFIHDRMPAVLEWAAAEEYLAGGDFRFSPFIPPTSSQNNCYWEALRRLSGGSPSQSAVLT